METLESFYDITQERGPNPGRYASTGLETTVVAADHGAALDICRACHQADECRTLGLFATDLAFMCAQEADRQDDAEMYHCLAGGGYAR